MTNEKIILIITTVATSEEANMLCKTLIKENLAACTQKLGPITSFYNWENKQCESEEWQCWIKSTETMYKKIENRIQEIHSYDIPQIICIPIETASEPYLNWVRGSF